MNVIEAIKDPLLLRPFFEDRDGCLTSYLHWMQALRCLYGLPVARRYHDLIRQCTGRDPERLPRDGFQQALFLVGRRSGKSLVSSAVGCFESVLAGHEEKLSKADSGVVAVLSPTLRQSRKVKEYMEAFFTRVPMLKQEVAKVTKEGFELRSGTRIEMMVADHRSCRGHTLFCSILDEVCFLGIDEDSKVKSDSELVTALRPALATVGGRLIAISSPYWCRGWAYDTWKRCWGNDDSGTLVWRSPSRVMNETLPQSIVDEALAEDYAKARSEWLAEWREDIQAYLPRRDIEACVVPGRLSLMPRDSIGRLSATPRDSIRYFAFADLSGGRVDSSALAIAHREGRGRVVLDFLREIKAPHNPYEAVTDFTQHCRRYGIQSVIGDAYGGDWVCRSFATAGIRYQQATKNKSELYLELIPKITGREIELLDHDRLINQLAALERRTHVGGRDKVDHPANGHDDCANVVAGVCEMASAVRRIGAIGPTRQVLSNLE